MTDVPEGAVPVAAVNPEGRGMLIGARFVMHTGERVRVGALSVRVAPNGQQWRLYLAGLTPEEDAEKLPLPYLQVGSRLTLQHPGDVGPREMVVTWSEATHDGNGVRGEVWLTDLLLAEWERRRAEWEHTMARLATKQERLLDDHEERP